MGTSVMTHVNGFTIFPLRFLYVYQAGFFSGYQFNKSLVRKRHGLFVAPAAVTENSARRSRFALFFDNWLVVTGTMEFLYNFMTFHIFGIIIPSD